MTSEVLILNKRAVVLAADSAVTVSGTDHPRYAKSANKIFEISHCGSVAAAIYGSDHFDTVPWELALKLYRTHLGKKTFASIKEYSESLLAYLKANNSLFPPKLRSQWIETQFDTALMKVISFAKDGDPGLFDVTLSKEDRQVRWKIQEARARELAAEAGIASGLSQEKLDLMLGDIAYWQDRAQSQIDEEPLLAGVDSLSLAQLGHIARYWRPDLLLNSTGLVVAGYGDDQIFPAFEQLDVCGHVGDELHVSFVQSHTVTHGNGATIQPLAQRSMIDMFTSGFGASLAEIIDEQGKNALKSAFDCLDKEGIVVPPELSAAITDRCFKGFESEWRRKNWDQNFHPLMSVLQNLSVQEMAHLAESLLGLESLKERVTSPSESVGGPIDVAVITKSEGLVWIKRKHYFDPELNMRYAVRSARSME